MPTPYQKMTIKVGSNVLTDEQTKQPNLELMEDLVEQIAELHHQNREIVLVSSGAVAAGRSTVQFKGKTDPVSERQVLASVGQVKLLQIYAQLFAKHGILCSQVLVTKEDFRDRTHYLNMKNCFSALLKNRIIPIVNENDVVSVTELMFTDNDELAGMVASMLQTEALFVLSNVDGVFDGDPNDPDTQLIPTIGRELPDFSKFISSKKSTFGRGGMITKCHLAHKTASLGISVHIANGKTPHILQKLAEKQPIGTHFLPEDKSVSDLKTWIAQSGGYAKGAVTVNAGAKRALLSNKAVSLLPVGVLGIRGKFDKGDIISILDTESNLIGVGVSRMDSQIAAEIAGQAQQMPLVHYDYLFLY